MTRLGAMKRLVNVGLARYGHAVAHASTVPSFERVTGLLGRYGLTPRTVIDIGVAYGTPWLYSAYPRAKYILVDPTQESLPHMHRWASELDADIVNLALGEQEGTLTIDVRPEIGDSSLFEEIGPHRSIAKYDVPVRRFDAVIGPFERPSLCKIDVQGAEAMVLRGMGERIRDIDAFVIEMSLIATVRGAPEAADVIGLLRERGFALYDIVGITRRPLDGAMAQIDATFVPEGSPLRQDRRWTDRA